MAEKIIICAAIALLLVGCDQSGQTAAQRESVSQTKSEANTNQAANANHTKAAPKVSQGTNSAKRSLSSAKGKIIETVNGGGYTYAKVEDGIGGQVWIAGKQTELKVGDRIDWGDYAVMRNFQSKALNRTFDTILFISHFKKYQPPKVTTGKVVSVTVGGGYSYIEADNNGQTTWLAAPMSKIKKGDVISWNGASTMYNFNAKSLGKTFEEIEFVARVDKVEAAIN